MDNTIPMGNEEKKVQCLRMSQESWRTEVKKHKLLSG